MRVKDENRKTHRRVARVVCGCNRCWAFFFTPHCFLCLSYRRSFRAFFFFFRFSLYGPCEISIDFYEFSTRTALDVGRKLCSLVRRSKKLVFVISVAYASLCQLMSHFSCMAKAITESNEKIKRSIWETVAYRVNRYATVSQIGHGEIVIRHARACRSSRWNQWSV